MKKVKVFVKNPGEEIRTETIEDSLKSYQELVGGNIEVIGIKGTSSGMIVNEEGKLLGLEPNFRYDFDILRGPVVVVSISGEEFVSVKLGLKSFEQIVKRGDLNG